MFKLTPFTATPRRRDEFADFSNLIDDFFNTSPLRSLRHDTFKIDVKDEEKQYVIEADLPGVKKEEVKVNYDEQALIIMVERKEENEEKENNYLHRERRICSMRRVLNLEDIDPDKIKAKLEDGVLIVTAAKAEVKNTSYVIDVE